MPTKSVVGINRIKKIKVQVRKDESGEFILRFKRAYTGLKRLVTTAARIITDIKGHKRRPRRKAETRKSARKNHKIILPEVLSCIVVAHSRLHPDQGILSICRTMGPIFRKNTKLNKEADYWYLLFYLPANPIATNNRRISYAKTAT